MRPGSPHSSISAEDRTTLASICLAKALVDSLPNPYDKEALRFKVRNNILNFTQISSLLFHIIHECIMYFQYISIM